MGEETIGSLHRLERTVLPALLKCDDVEHICKHAKLKSVEVLRTLRWLKDKKLAEVREESSQFVEIEDNGRLYSKNGLPERRFLRAIEDGKTGMSELIRVTGLSREEVNVSIGILRKKGFILMEKGEEPVFEITEEGREKLEEGFHAELTLKKLDRAVELASLDEREKEDVRMLQTRRGILRVETRKKISAMLTPEGRKLAENKEINEKVVDRLTPGMIKSGNWKGLRSYNLKAPVPKLNFGKKQPYRRFLDEVRIRLTALGFKEMSGPIVESEFWNMDALFMPQFHSARDIHDVYYVKNPSRARDLPMKTVERVKQVHEKGLPGSRGWGYKFDYAKTARHILRSHDTSISPRTLSSKDLKIPGKYFQIVRCFRCDVIDATHNADFDQIGGFVVDDNLNLKHLFGVLRLFAKEFCGTDEVKVVPSYFPFTEPSASLYAKHPSMGWIELAGAGIFRPEMTRPLGVEKPVIAWGIGLGRVAMFRLGIKDIRQLYSHNLEFLRSAKVI